jgi:hypothetical protein
MAAGVGAGAIFPAIRLDDFLKPGQPIGLRNDPLEKSISLTRGLALAESSLAWAGPWDR